MAGETKLKLVVDEECRPSARRALGAEKPSRCESIYFDTAKLDLSQNRVELCLRRSAGQVVQALTMRAQNDNVFACVSHEIALSDLQPNIDHARAFLPASVGQAISRSALKPRFRASTNRISRFITNKDCIANITFDQGTMKAPRGTEPISEIGLELQSGRLDAFAKECLSFLDQVPAGILVEGNAARGYRLVSGEPARAARLKRIVVPPQTPLPEAILRILRHGLQHFLDNHPAVTLSGEAESIHQMRVGMRRLRSAIRMFSPVLCLEGTTALFASLRVLFAKLGDVREADVFVQETLPQIGEAGLGERLEAVLRTEIEAFRRKAYHDVREALMSPDFARAVVRLNEWVETGNWLKADQPVDALLAERAAEDFAVPRVTRLYAKLIRCGARAEQGSLNDWHRARIAAKRLRYGGEPLFGALAPKIDAGQFAKQISRLQTLLGKLNDLESVASLFARVRPAVKAANRHDFEAAEQFCRGWSGATAVALVARAKEATRNLNGPEPTGA
jgi:triphosphatase